MPGEHTLYHILRMFAISDLRDSFHLRHGMQNRCLITFYVTITQTLITSLIVLDCITELYTEILIRTFVFLKHLVIFSQLYLNCMNKN